MESRIKCPKCNSTQIHSDKKGFSAGKAMAGAILTGPVGITAGAIGQNKIIITCLKCGNKFTHKDIKSGNEKIEQYSPVTIEYKNDEYNTIICSKCKGETLYSHNYCSTCGKKLSDEDEKILKEKSLLLSSCEHCNGLKVKNGNYCSKCGKVNKNKSGCAASIVILILISSSSLLYAITQ